jgi:UPF0716 protein FxsA
MGIALFLIIVAFPAVEILLFVLVGDRIGALPTVALVLASGVAGVLLVRAQGAQAIRRAQASLERGDAPVREALDGAALLVAGLLLLVPGFFTDLLALPLLAPAVRRALAAALLRRAGRRPPAETVVEGDFHVVDEPEADPKQVRGPAEAG